MRTSDKPSKVVMVEREGGKGGGTAGNRDEISYLNILTVSVSQSHGPTVSQSHSLTVSQSHSITQLVELRVDSLRGAPIRIM